ncbi:MAG: hypothetical protein ACYTG4_11825 [Planctomycetota bacterium]|jgi:hypothetical protein
MTTISRFSSIAVASVLVLAGSTMVGAQGADRFEPEVRFYEVVHRGQDVPIRGEDGRLIRNKHGKPVTERLYQSSHVHTSMDLVFDSPTRRPDFTPLEIYLGGMPVLMLDEEDLERNPEEGREPGVRLRISPHRNRRVHYRNRNVRVRLRWTRNRLRIDLRARGLTPPDDLGDGRDPARIFVRLGDDAHAFSIDVMRAGRERWRSGRQPFISSDDT